MSQNDPDIVYQPYISDFPDVDKFSATTTTTATTTEPIDALMALSDYAVNQSNQIGIVPQDNMIHANSVDNLPDNNFQWITCSPAVNGDNISFVQNWSISSSSNNEGLHSNNIASLDLTVMQDNNNLTAHISTIQTDIIDLTRTNGSSNNHECKVCIINSMDRGPFDKINTCNKCQAQWTNFIASTTFKKTNDASVSQILHDRQVRLTRNMAQELMDDYGFGPNIHGYRRDRPVFINTCHQDQKKKDYIGVLQEQKQGKVKVWVPDFESFEWLPVGSKRLKTMTPQEEQEAYMRIGTTNIPIQDEAPLLPTQVEKTHHKSNKKQPRIKRPPVKSNSRQKRTRASVTAKASKAAVTASAAIHGIHLTTGNFSKEATKSQSKDNDGFIPNSYGYAKNRSVQILDIENNKIEAWSHGTLVAMRPGFVKVHYEKGSKRYYEWIDTGSQRIKLLAEENTATACLMMLDEDSNAENEPKKSGRQSEKSIGDISQQNNARPITSLRIAQIKASETEHFAPNAYGYHYMQHITVLDSNKKYYEARITSLQKNKVKIHYCGWIDKFDELIPLGSKRIRVLEDDKEADCLEPNYCERYEQSLHDNNPPCRPNQEKISAVEDLKQYQVAKNKDNDTVTKICCSQCNSEIKRFRYYCSYCEAPSPSTPCSIDQNSQSFQLCPACFDYSFPSWHQHPRSGFAFQAMTNDFHQEEEHDTTMLWEHDILPEQGHNVGMPLEASKVFTGTEEISAQDGNGYLFLQKWKDRKICGFCNDDDDNSQELGPFIGPFTSTSMKLGQEKKRTVWAHYACARYSPEVSYSAEEKKWYNVTKALKRGRSMELTKCLHVFRQSTEKISSNATKKTQLFPQRPRKLPDGSTSISCCYCGTSEAKTWRKGYDGGIMMCEPCFDVVYAKHSSLQDGLFAVDSYAASIEDYSHKPYFTRDTLSLTKPVVGPRLTSYEPQPNQTFSLTFDSTYFDIPGRAPRWASHSGTDYHGTWLPQTVRRALLKYTKKDERVLSNFLGRGTDAIECFLLQRKCCGIDINPAAIALSQRNCCFQVPEGLTFAEYRPIIALTDARQLNGSLFNDESYHHVLSHPPYKDCIAYSTHLDGDLSRFTRIEDFKQEYTRVIRESYRVLKMSRRVTLGIGDNREHCFYVPVGFHLLRLYIDQGFELEELIVKRQRYCSAFGLGTYLCVQFDFLIFTHEFIATFKKIPHHRVDKMTLALKTGTSLIQPPVATTVLCMASHLVLFPEKADRMIERFGQDDCNWLHVELVTDMLSREHNQQEESGSSEGLQMKISRSTEVETISEYEQERLKKIQENNEILLKLGLVSDLSQESAVNDSIYCDTLLSRKPYVHADLAVMATGHIAKLAPEQITVYRQSVVKLAQDAMVKLPVKGLLIVGTMDIRDEKTGKLWPISMLVLEDIERTTSGLKLKELVTTVPEGYSKNRDRTEVQQEPEHLPIMSFLAEFNKSIYEPWRIEYVAFEAILNGLRAICESGHWTRQDEEDFESAIRLEAGKVDLFINCKQREIESRVLYCQRTLVQQKSMSEKTRNSTDDTLTDILADINDLTKFTRLNFKALERLIQEHDRLTNTNRQPLLVEVCRTRPLDSQRFDGILVQVSSLLDKCRGRLALDSNTDNNSSNTTKSRRQGESSSARYWVHQDNATEVKAVLLFNLPIFGDDSYKQSERAMSYVYLDNASFSEYTAQLQSDNGAELITCRWDGDIHSASQVFVERHVFVKGGFSTQDGIALNANRLHDFVVTKSYSAEEYAQDLTSVGFDQNYVDSSYTIAKSIQGTIIDKQLKPKLRVQFNRLHFEAPHDKSLSVSLDNDVSLSATLDKPSSIDWLNGFLDNRQRFPYAILETRVQDQEPPPWLSRLLESNLVYEVPRFSICLHGVALLWGPQLPLLPWWLSQIDVDIRTAKKQDKLLVEGASEYSGLTRSNSLRPLIDGQYRMGYLEAQLQKRLPQRRQRSLARHGSQYSSNSSRHQSIVITDETLHAAVDSKEKAPEYVVQLEDANASRLTLQSTPTANDEQEGLRSRSSLKQLQTFSDFYRPQEGGSQAYMLQDPHTIKDNDQMRKAMLTELAQEKEEKKKKKKKQKPPQHTMEPKLFFANERTFINWLQFSALIMTAALTLLNFGDHVSTIAGATFFGISMVIALYAFFRYRYRAYQMSTRPDIRYDDLFGPVGLCCLLVGAMALNFALRWQHPSASDTYLGVNNKTDEQS
ncbi:hypothetical protein [Parasitella parasitica]|uniref:SPX domain-containing protein n=1 Tax=Parasitella parasitica TaxID=35722 RepID=A0A0B7MPY3_9FUNG|nr:hypothetical protein [Parasitella parasitica]